jgi:two-component system response regulator AtoC
MVVDADPSMHEFLRAFLSTRGYEAVTVGNAEEALQRYRAERPSAVILDVVLPGNMDGLGALAAFKKIDRDVPIIVLSGEGRTASVVRAMRLGASDFVGKPFDETDLDARLIRVLEQRQFALEKASMRAELRAQPCFKTLSNEVRDAIERLTDTDVPTLVRGERGTGKEFVARALCSRSRRHDKPFVKVNCAGLSQELLEETLFGLERGTFNAAAPQKPGKFEFTNHGTIFLDEIGEMSPPLQAKLLQLVQDGEFLRRGGTSPVRVDVRVIAATTGNEDPFLRLNGGSITLPPLRERRDEIPVLADYFLTKHAVQYNRARPGLTAKTMRMFMDYDWPGNVRELEELIERAVVLGTESNEITQRISLAAHRMAPSEAAAARSPVTSAPVLTPAPAPSTPTSIAAAAADAGNFSLKEISRSAAREAERELILRMLQRTRWNRKETAELLGISYKALLYKIKENGLDKVDKLDKVDRLNRAS